MADSTNGTDERKGAPSFLLFSSRVPFALFVMNEESDRLCHFGVGNDAPTLSVSRVF